MEFNNNNYQSNEQEGNNSEVEQKAYEVEWRESASQNTEKATQNQNAETAFQNQDSEKATQSQNAEPDRQNTWQGSATQNAWQGSATQNAWQQPNAQAQNQWQQPTQDKPKKKHSFLKAIGLAAVFGIVAGGIIVGSSLVSRFFTPCQDVTITDGGNQALISGEVSDTDLSVIVENAMPSIVSITNKSVANMKIFGMWDYQQEQVGAGSGIIYGKNDTELLIVTNYHVVADNEELRVYFNDVDVSNMIAGSTDMDSVESYVATIKDGDSDLDLAVISVKLADLPDSVKDSLVFATPGDSSQMKAGQRVIAIGNALGYGKSVTTGIISATSRSVTMQSTDGVEVTNSYIQTDATINPGNSGGALLNMNGELIGINSAKIVSSGVEGMGYAIPISDVKDIIGEMLVAETREEVPENERGTLGISGQSVSEEVSKAYNIPVGVSIRKVYEGSASQNAGLKEGYIITKLNNKKVRTIEELQKLLTGYRAGEQVTIVAEVMSDGGYKEQEFNVVLDTAEKLNSYMDK